MANKRIDELDAITSLADNDKIAIVSSTTTYHTTMSALKINILSNIEDRISAVETQLNNTIKSKHSDIFMLMPEIDEYDEIVTNAKGFEDHRIFYLDNRAIKIKYFTHQFTKGTAEITVYHGEWVPVAIYGATSLMDENNKSTGNLKIISKFSSSKSISDSNYGEASMVSSASGTITISTADSLVDAYDYALGRGPHIILLILKRIR